MRRRLAMTTVLALLAAAVAAGCGGGDGSGGTSGGTGTTVPAAQKATLVLDWFPNADHAGIFGAVREGFLEDEGVLLSTRVPADPTTTLKEIGTGRVEFGLSYEPEVLIARSQGVPVVAVGAVVVHPLNSVMARSDRGITRPRDLEGRTVGIAGVPSDRALLDTVVRADGGDPSKVTTRVVGFSLAPALAAGRVDATIGAYWNVEGVDLKAKGVPLTIMRLEENGVPDYDELVVVTSDRVAREKPELVRSVLAGLRRGQEWAAANQAAAAGHLTAANPDLDASLLPGQIRLTAPLLAPADEPALTVDPAEWRRFADWMTANDLLQKPVDVGAAVTSEYLPGP